MSKRLFIWIGLAILAAVIAAAGWSAYITFNRNSVEAPPKAVRGKIPAMPPATISPSQTTGAQDPQSQQPAPTDSTVVKAETDSQTPQDTTDSQAADQQSETNTEPAGQPVEADRPTEPDSDAKTDPASVQKDGQDSRSGSEQPTDRQGKDEAAGTETDPTSAGNATQTDTKTPSAPTQASTEQTSPDTAQSPADDASTQQEPDGQVLKPFTIQVGAYRTKSYAENAVTGLTRKGYKAYIFEDTDAKNRAWYVVRIGQFEKHSEAQAVLGEYKEKEQKSAIITRTSAR